MLLTVVILSGTLLSATTIAGLLMLYQIRQSVDIANSTKAFYAADSGLEQRLYQFIKEENVACDSPLEGTLSNGATFRVECSVKVAKAAAVGVAGAETATIKSTGEANKNYRALEIKLSREIPPLPPPPAP